MDESKVAIAYNLSGAVEAVRAGRFVVLVDVIDMSTTLETVREAGACGLGCGAQREKLAVCQPVFDRAGCGKGGQGKRGPTGGGRRAKRRS